MERKPTAVFSASISLSQYTFRKLMEMGMKIPQDISLLCYDDDPWLQGLKFSVVAHPLQDFCNAVVQDIFFHETIEDKMPISAVRLPMRLIERNSVIDIC